MYGCTRSLTHIHTHTQTHADVEACLKKKTIRVYTQRAATVARPNHPTTKKSRKNAAKKKRETQAKQEERAGVGAGEESRAA